MSTDVSEVHAASIIIVLMMEAARTSETSVDILLRTLQYIPEDSGLHTRCRENLKSHNSVQCLTTGFRYPAEAKKFSSSLCVQTSSEVHPASYPTGTGGPFPGVKSGLGVMLTTHPSIAEVKNEYEPFFLSPSRLHGGSGTAWLCFTNVIRHSRTSSTAVNTFWQDTFLRKVNS
jgi:hypothetical protein